MIESVRQPEYTGSNRCWACTWANLAITTAITGLVAGLAWTATSALVSVLVGGAVAMVSGLLIWLRGYLIPGTPTLTARYMPPWLLAWFGKETAGADETLSHQTGSHYAPDFDLETVLVDAGVLSRRESGRDGGTGTLQLTETFEDAWQQAATSHPSSDPADVMTAVEFNTSAVDIETFDTGAVAWYYDAVVHKWPSSAAVEADVLSADLLPDWVADWEAMAPAERCRLLRGVRVFLSECPDGSPARLTEDTIESCCTSSSVATIECERSGERLLEQPVGD